MVLLVLALMVAFQLDAAEGKKHPVIVLLNMRSSPNNCPAPGELALPAFEQTPKQQYAAAVQDFKRTKAVARAVEELDHTQADLQMHEESLRWLASTYQQSASYYCTPCGWLGGFLIRLCNGCCFEPSNRDLLDARAHVEISGDVGKQ